MANPTTNFGWVMPTSSSLVTNLPADFNTFGQAVDTSMSELLGGTTGQVLSKTSNTNMDFTWVTPTDQTPLTTKGDLFTFTTVDARLGVGTNGQILSANSATATGLEWITNDVGDITAVTAGTGISGGGTSGAVTITNSMATAIDAKGDLIGGTGADTFSRLAVGTNGQVLTADSTAGTGLAWATPSGGFPAWTSYTPTVTAGSGSITTYTAQGLYSQSGKAVVVAVKVNITTVGTAVGTMSITLPITAKTVSGTYWTGSSVENNTTGYSGWATIGSGSNTIVCRNYNFTTYFGSGNEVIAQVTYEVA